jgi:hypothetical protein
MAPKEFEDYEYVDADVIKRAALDNDPEAIRIIYVRYESDIDKAIRIALCKGKLSCDRTIFNDIKNTVWIELEEEIRRFRPK